MTVSRAPDLSAVRVALEAEQAAREASREARNRLAEAVSQAVDRGVRYDVVARMAVKSRTGRAPTLAERRREVDRLRHLRHRHRMTNSHGEVAQAVLSSTPPSVSSMGEEKVHMRNQDPPLLRRRVVEEIFEGGENVADLNDDVDSPEDAEVDGETDGGDEP